MIAYIAILHIAFSYSSVKVFINFYSVVTLFKNFYCFEKVVRKMSTSFKILLVVKLNYFSL